MISRFRAAVRNLPGMKPGRLLSPRRVALSLEGTTLRILSSEGSKVTAWANIPFNPALVRNGFIANPSGMAQVLGAVFARKEFQPGRILVALPGFQSLARIITLPPARALNASVVVSREARRLMSFSPEASYLFWKKLPNGLRPRYLALTVPRDPLLNLVETMSLARARVSQIDLKPLCLARAANLSQAIIANAEPGTLDLVVVARGIPLAIRSLFVGDDASQPEVLLPRLAEELERFIAFFNSTNPNDALPPDLPVQLSGSLARDPAAEGQIKDVTGRPVLLPHPPLKLPADFPTGDFAVSLGLLLKEL